MKKKVYIALAVISLICYLSVFIPPGKIWPAGFITYLIPFVLLTNIFLLLRDLSRLKISFLVPLGLIITGWGFIYDTIHFSRNRGGCTIKVMSYNVRVFDIYDPSSLGARVPEKMSDWIRNTQSDIICLQEFYNEPDSPDRNTLRMINSDNRYHVFNRPVYINRIGAQFGVVIFSRFPIARDGQIRFGGNTQNQAVFADVVIGPDTVRIYNLHLQSMHINEKELMDYEGDLEVEMKDLFGRLKYGFIQRSDQIRIIREHIRHCPYRVIVCGDFNDLPYSYAYHQLKRILTNSFAEAGRGFGFTYNGKLPFLRIDNQFFSKGIHVCSLRTSHAARYSDHFPVTGTYSIIPAD